MPPIHVYTYDEFISDVAFLCKNITEQFGKPDLILTLPRGGLVPATYVAHKLEVSHIMTLDEYISEGCPGGEIKALLIDDISDTGTALNDALGALEHRLGIAGVHIDLRTATMWVREGTSCIPDFHVRAMRGIDWISFPWEHDATQVHIGYFLEIMYHNRSSRATTYPMLLRFAVPYIDSAENNFDIEAYSLVNDPDQATHFASTELAEHIFGRLLDTPMYQAHIGIHGSLIVAQHAYNESNLI